MIVKSGSGYKVKSESGKNLSKTLPTREAAERRLKQVEWFKNYGSAKNSHPFSLDPWNKGKCLICGQTQAMHKIDNNPLGLGSS